MLGGEGLHICNLGDASMAVEGHRQSHGSKDRGSSRSAPQWGIIMGQPIALHALGEFNQLTDSE